MELRQYVEIIWKRWWLIALTTVLAAVAAFVVSSMQTPMYRSTTTVEIISGADPAEDPYYAVRNAEAIASTYVVQITSPAVVESVLDRLQLSMETEDAQKLISALQVNNSSMVEISGESANPALVIRKWWTCRWSAENSVSKRVKRMYACGLSKLSWSRNGLPGWTKSAASRIAYSMPSREKRRIGSPRPSPRAMTRTWWPASRAARARWAA